MQNSFRTIDGQAFAYPLFFPDATRGMVRSVDNQDLEQTGTEGVLVNTYHLWRMISEERMSDFDGIRSFMGWQGAIISDSGGFQVMSIAKRGHGTIVDEGVWFKPPNSPRLLLTPELSIKYQLAMKTDLVVVLDDYTVRGASERETRAAVVRTIQWAKRSKATFDSECERLEIPIDKRPYLVAVNQGGLFYDLRKYCSEALAEIGFTAYGYGGFSKRPDGKIDMDLTRHVVDSLPKDSLLYGLGVGKPDEVVEFYRLGFQIFDCVLPTRDARHGRLYTYAAANTETIDVTQPDFYEYYVPAKAEHADADVPISTACDCHTCMHYSRAYISHLSKVKDTLFYRLATIHNLRFYAILTEKLRSSTPLR